VDDEETKMKVVVVIPAWNESKSIYQIVKKCRQHADEVMVCDDGSTDHTYLMAAKAGATVFAHKDNLGYGHTLRDLFTRAFVFNPDIIVTVDGDGQHDPSDIPRFVEAIRGGADVAAGARTERDSMTRRVGSQILDVFAGSDDSQCGFRAYRASIIPKVLPSEMGMGAGAEILQKAKEAGLEIARVPVYIAENDEHSQNAVSQGLEVMLSSVKVRAIKHPLVTFGIPGLAFLLCACGFLYWSLELFVTTKSLPFGPTLAAIATGAIGLGLMGMAALIWIMVTVVRMD
jgi:glycosyltransferase involved in cell wall biosynthesis